MSDPGNITARIWLFLLHQGGRWSANDIALELRIDEGAHIAGNLHSMALSGTVRRYEKAGRGKRVEFGVTCECIVPRNIPVQAVVDCMGSLA